MKPGYFVDSSVWISYFRDTSFALGDWVDELIDENRVHINGMVLVELLSGARSEAEFARLASALAGLKIIPSDRASYEAAGRNGYALKRKGISVPLSDVVIATDCLAYDLVLVEADKHFAAIAAYLPLRIYSPRR